MKQHFLIYETCTQICKIMLEDVVFIEQVERKVKISTIKGVYCMRKKIDMLDVEFEKNFFRCHSGILINCDKVVSMVPPNVFFENGESISLGAANYRRAKQYYAGYVKKLF